MTRYIDADKLYQKMLDLQGTKRERYLDIDDVRKIIKEQPTVYVTGEWKRYGDALVMCPYCDYICNIMEKGKYFNHCPNCGAKLES